MLTIHTTEELAAYEGKEWLVTDWLPITQQMIDDFAATTGDQQWIHTDPERAKKTPFGTTIAHGFLLLSLIPKLLGTDLKFKLSPMMINYGCDKVRFIHPVITGSKVRLRSRLLKWEHSDQGIKIWVENTLEIANNSKPAMVSVNILLFAGAGK